MNQDLLVNLDRDIDSFLNRQKGDPLITTQYNGTFGKNTQEGADPISLLDPSQFDLSEVREKP